VQTDYQILSDVYPPDLAAKIKHAEEEGWCLQGGVAVSISNDGRQMFHQAMVRDAE
jgi:hypothetical protein